MTSPDAAASDAPTDPAECAGVARIRRAQPDDAWAISALLWACRPRCVAQPPEAVLRAIDQWRVVAQGDGRILGSVRLRLGFGVIEIGGVAVDADARGLGVGSALLREALAAQRECRLDLLCVTCEPEFFARFGFEIEAGAPPARPGLDESLDRARVQMRRRARALTA